MPVAMVTPDCEPGYGVKLEKTSGALPDSLGQRRREHLHLRLHAGTRADDDVVGQRVSVDVGTRDGHAAGEAGVERGEPGELGLERPVGGVVAVVGDHLGGNALAGADDQVEDHVAVDVGHRDRRRALEVRERGDGLRAPCRRCRRAPGRSPACPVRSGYRDRVRRHLGDDVDESPSDRCPRG